MPCGGHLEAPISIKEENCWQVCRQETAEIPTEWCQKVVEGRPQCLTHAGQFTGNPCY